MMKSMFFKLAVLALSMVFCVACKNSDKLSDEVANETAECIVDSVMDENKNAIGKLKTIQGLIDTYGKCRKPLEGLRILEIDHEPYASLSEDSIRKTYDFSKIMVYSQGLIGLDYGYEHIDSLAWDEFYIKLTKREEVKETLKGFLQGRYRDSKGLEETTEESIAGFKEYIERKTDYDYLVFVNNIVFTGPAITGSDTFSSGHIESLVTILDLRKEIPIMQFTFHAVNSDQIFYLDRGDATPSALVDRMMKDIEKDQLLQFTLNLARLGIAPIQGK